MDDSSSDGFPADLLSEGVAAVDSQGKLTPCNEVMRRLLRLAAEERVPAQSPAGMSLTELPFEDGARARLTAGASADLWLAANHFEVRLVHRGERAWLVCTDQASADLLLHVQLASARARSLGALAATIMHDLANQLAAGMGVAEVLRPHVTRAEDLVPMEELMASARQGVALGRGLARMLSRPRARHSVDLAELLEEVTAMLGKHCSRHGAELVVSNAAKDALVYLHAEVATQAVLHAILFGLDQGARTIQVRSAIGSRGVAGGRQRNVGLVAVVLHGAAEDACKGVRDCVSGVAGTLPTANQLGENAVGLLQAAMVLAACGGELTSRWVSGELHLEFAWRLVLRGDR